MTLDPVAYAVTVRVTHEATANGSREMHAPFVASFDRETRGERPRC